MATSKKTTATPTDSLPLEQATAVSVPETQARFTLNALELEYISILNAIEDCDGEITPELEEALKINEADRNKKIAGYHYLIGRQEADQDAIQREIDRLKLAKERVVKRTELLKNHLMRALMLFGENTGTDAKPLFKLSIKYGDTQLQLGTRRSEVVTITSEDDLPADFWRRPPVPDMVVDKTKIKEALKAGEEVPGAELTANFSLTIK